MAKMKTKKRDKQRNGGRNGDMTIGYGFGGSRFGGNMTAPTVNALLTRQGLLSNLFDDRRDIDDECGYPKVITPTQYKYLFEREGIAERVVNVWPEETWVLEPTLTENEDSEQTAFEETWEDLNKEFRFWHYLSKVDLLSGIGHFGLLLLGVDDGLPLSEPIDGINLDGTADRQLNYELVYLRAYDESQITIDTYDKDPESPRHGLPILYSIQQGAISTQQVEEDTSTSVKVHWTRVIHVAETQKTASEVYGVPRMRPVFNRLYDLRKLIGGSAEMFWKGAFPGFSFELNPDMVGDVELDKKALREEFENYSNGLQRYLATQGLHVRSLAPQVASPKDHFEIQMRAISVTIRVPIRVFKGTEEARLAADQDTKAFNKRLVWRQNHFVTPIIIRPFVNRITALGILPEVEVFDVAWADLESLSEQTRAEVGKIKTEAIVKYAASGAAETLIPPLEYFIHILGMDEEVAEAIVDAAEEVQADLDRQQEDDEVLDEFGNLKEQGGEVDEFGNPIQQGEQLPNVV